MKKIYYIIIILLLLSNCKKRPFDYRNKYVGEYEFDYSYYSWSMSTNQDPIINRETSLGEVYYDKKEEKDLIKVKVSDDIIFESIVNKDGNLNFCGGSGNLNDNLTIEYASASCPGSSNGAGIVYSIEGIKI